MATSAQAWEESAAAGLVAAAVAEGASTEASEAQFASSSTQETDPASPAAAGQSEASASEAQVAAEPVSSAEETEQGGPVVPTLGNPVPGLRASQEELFAPEESGIPSETGAPAESAGLPPPAEGSEEEPGSGAATPRPAASRASSDYTGLPTGGLPSPPSVVPSSGNFGVHPGPASTSSISNGRFDYDADAPEFTPGVPYRPALRVVPRFDEQGRPLTEAQRALLQGPPVGTRDPMNIPRSPFTLNRPLNPADTARHWNSAAYHAAMVTKRLMDVDNDLARRELDAVFTRIFRDEYADAVVRVIASPPPSTVAANDQQEAEELEDIYGDGNGDGQQTGGNGEGGAA